MARTRVRRKDLKKPDEFVTMTGHALVWLRENTQLAAMVGGAVLLIFAAIGITGAFRAARLRDANADLGRAMATLRATDLNAAASEFSAVAQRWESTPVALLASVLAANTEMRLGNRDAALTSIQKLLDGGQELPPYLRQQLLVARGTALSDKGDWAGAAAQFAAAAEVSGPYVAEAILAEARARERGGEADRARELYRKYYEQFPDQPDRDLVRTKIEL